jgi:hypothetical protein
LLTFIYFIKKNKLYIKYHKNQDNTSISLKIIEKMTYEKLKDHKKREKHNLKEKPFHLQLLLKTKTLISIRMKY